MRSGVSRVLRYPTLLRLGGGAAMLASLFFICQVFIEGLGDWPPIAYLAIALIPLVFIGGLYFVTFSVQVLSWGVEWRGGLRGTRRVRFEDMGIIVSDKFRLQLFPKDWDQYSRLRKLAEMEARDFGLGNVLKVDAVVITPEQFLEQLEANSICLIVKGSGRRALDCESGKQSR